MIEVRTLADGGQTAQAVAAEIADFLGSARRALDVALYDVRLSEGPARIVADAFEAAAARGVAVRLAYNVDHRKPLALPPPPQHEPSLVESLGVPTKGIPGVPDLMHHKFVVRDGETVWAGSTNWTQDSWTREENVIVRVESSAVAANYTRDFEQLWTTGSVEGSGDVAPSSIEVGGARVSTWFSPDRGPALAHRIANRIGRARTRIRIASPIITAAPILGTLAEVEADGRVDVAGVVDQTQVLDVLRQWRENGNASWKGPLLRAVLERAPFSAKRSTPYRPGSVHDYMHAKVTVADDTCFIGSYNLSHSGEMNAENVLEIEDEALADQMAAFVDEIRARYDPPVLDGAFDDA